MNLSKIFIVRPIATTVLVAAVVIFGLIAFRTLPVNELPNVDFPTITGRRGAARRQPRGHGVYGCDAA